MNGVYKIYDKEKGIWVEMPMYFKGDKGESGDSTVVPGSVEKSATLEGLNNKAISEASSALGEDSTAGLKGWYYTSIELDESNNTYLITLSDTQPTVNNGELVGTWTSETVNVKKGDKISIVNNSKFDFCGEVTGYKNNKIRVKDLQFDTIEIPETISRDDFSIYLPEKPDAGIIDFGHGAFSQGVNTKSSNLASHAEGSGTHAYGQYSHTEGRETKAGYGAHAEGRETVASGNLSHAEGRESVASGAHSHAEGRKTVASNTQSHAEGKETKASGENSHAEGESSIASGSRAHAEGDSSTASGNQSHAEGKSTIASGSSAHTEGYETTASGIASHAEGYKSQAQASGSHAEGGYYINSIDSEAGGIASGNASHAEGINTDASGIASHAEGRQTNSSNNHSHAEGYATKALGAQSHSEGNATTAKGSDTHSEGKRSCAFGNQSHAEGLGSESLSDDILNAENAGDNIKTNWESTKKVNVAVGIASHVEGRDNLAYGARSHAGGYRTETIGNNSFAHGDNVKTTNENEVAFGKYNVSSDETLFSVGNGTSDTARKNVFEITTDGLIYIYKKDGTRVCLQDLL